MKKVIAILFLLILVGFAAYLYLNKNATLGDVQTFATSNLQTDDVMDDAPGALIEQEEKQNMVTVSIPIEGGDNVLDLDETYIKPEGDANLVIEIPKDTNIVPELEELIKSGHVRIEDINKLRIKDGKTNKEEREKVHAALNAIPEEKRLFFLMKLQRILGSSRKDISVPHNEKGEVDYYTHLKNQHEEMLREMETKNNRDLIIVD